MRPPRSAAMRHEQHRPPPSRPKRLRNRPPMPHTTPTTPHAPTTTAWCCSTVAGRRSVCRCTAAKTGRSDRSGPKASRVGCEDDCHARRPQNRTETGASAQRDFGAVGEPLKMSRFRCREEIATRCCGARFLHQAGLVRDEIGRSCRTRVDNARRGTKQWRLSRRAFCQSVSAWTHATTQGDSHHVRPTHPSWNQADPP